MATLVLSAEQAKVLTDAREPVEVPARLATG